jgi:hypothetical protein
VTEEKVAEGNKDIFHLRAIIPQKLYHLKNISI